MKKRKPIVAVIGASQSTQQDEEYAYEIGRLLAQENWILINGGLEGVMEASAKGASLEKGIVVGILPGPEASAANAYITIPLATNMFWGRNAIIAQAADIFVAIGGSYGTLSEIALALAHKKKVFGLNSWEIEGVTKVSHPQEAIERIRAELKLLK